MSWYLQGTDDQYSVAGERTRWEVGNHVLSVAEAPDGALVASAGATDIVEVLDTKKGRSVTTLQRSTTHCGLTNTIRPRTERGWSFLLHFTDPLGTSPGHRHRENSMSPLERFAARCASESSPLAYALAAYQRRNGFTDEILAAILGCTLDINRLGTPVD